MMKKIGESLFLVLLAWCGWVFIGANPSARMQRACTAVSGPGHLLASLASAAGTDFGAAVQHGTDNGTYRCQLTLWNFFYADAWKQQHPGQPLPGYQTGGFASSQPYTQALLQNQADQASQQAPQPPASAVPAQGAQPSAAPRAPIERHDSVLR
jgi:hypothetical protein